MNQSTLHQLTMGLDAYNHTAYKLMGTVSQSMEKVAVVLLLLLMGIDIFSWHQHLKNNGGEMVMSLWFELIIKYVVACFLVFYIDDLLNVFSWFFNGVIKLLGNQAIAPFSSKAPSYKGVGAIAKSFFQITYYIVDFVGQLSTKLIILMRSYSLYIYGAIAKLMVACYMIDSLRSLCLNFIKSYLALLLQGVLLVLILMFYPAIVTGDLLSVASRGAWIPALTAIAKGVIFIILLFGSQRMAKSLMQVN